MPANINYNYMTTCASLTTIYLRIITDLFDFLLYLPYQLILLANLGFN